MPENCAVLPRLCLAPSEASQIPSSESGLTLCPCVPSHPNAWPGGGNHAKEVVRTWETHKGCATRVALGSIVAEYRTQSPPKV